jgi:hypothetical protein
MQENVLTWNEFSAFLFMTKIAKPVISQVFFQHFHVGIFALLRLTSFFTCRLFSANCNASTRRILSDVAYFNEILAALNGRTWRVPRNPDSFSGFRRDSNPEPYRNEAGPQMSGVAALGAVLLLASSLSLWLSGSFISLSVHCLETWTP